MSFKILHLSDLHIEDERPEKEIKQFGHIINKIKEKYQPDNTVIIITGDIDNLPRSRNYKRASSLLKQLEKYTILPVPGNHDFMEGDASDHWDSVREFMEAILQPNPVAEVNRWRYPLNIPLEYKKDRVHFFGINSLNRIEGLYQIAQGLIGPQQTSALIDKIEKAKKDDPKAIIVTFLHHHPFPLYGLTQDFPLLIIPAWHMLVDGDKFLKAISRKVDILLFGHEHWHFKMDNKYGIRHILSCSRSTDPNMGEYPVKPDGTIVHDPEPKPEGLLGWEINITEETNISIEKKNFSTM